MWIRTNVAHPPLDEKNRNEHVWLFQHSRGIFLGTYVEFGPDEPVEDHEYGDGKGRCYPSHFWTGEDEPGYPPRT